VSDLSEPTTRLERQRSEFERFQELAAAMGAEIRVVAVRTVGKAGARAVAVFFRHDGFPDVLFAYRCMPPGTDRHERVWLAEALATGGLHTVMHRTEPNADADGVVWLRMSDFR
jgi:hypothetical protein